MSETKIHKGTKITPEEAAKLDRSKMGVALANRPEAPEVEGQQAKLAVTECPWCGHFGYSVIDTEFYQWYTCGACGRPFKA